jgi:hypothetical protein
MNLFKAAMHLVSFCTSLMQVAAFILVMAEIFSGLASMPRWLMMKLSSFPEGTPKMHLFGLTFQRYSRRDAKVSSRSAMRVVGVSGLDDHVVHVGFDVLVELSLETGLDTSLVGSAGVLQPE